MAERKLGIPSTRFEALRLNIEFAHPLFGMAPTLQVPFVPFRVTKAFDVTVSRSRLTPSGLPSGITGTAPQAALGWAVPFLALCCFGERLVALAEPLSPFSPAPLQSLRRSNGSLRNFLERYGSAKHCWRSASLQPPSRRGSIADMYLGGRLGRPLFCSEYCLPGLL